MSGEDRSFEIAHQTSHVEPNGRAWAM
jgi:hypothetical protein